MEISRRNALRLAPAISMPVLLAGGCQHVPSANAPATGNARNWDEFGFIGPNDDPDFSKSQQNGSIKTTVGTGQSRHDEVRTAFKILWDCPRTASHMDIARYFQNITQTNPNERDASGELARYNEEWSQRANPLITSFFGMTNTLPSGGDQTAWCAAFVSFVLYAAGKPNQFSALSGSYRSYGRPTTDPRLGDIVVFRRNGPAGDRGFGHVGFFVSQTDNAVTVLGGNQRGGEGSTGAVVERNYAKIGTSLSLHSIRAVV